MILLSIFSKIFSMFGLLFFKWIKEKRGTRSCNKKMEPHGELWQCAAGHESSHPMARWMCQFIACDHTGSQYIASFDEVSWPKPPEGPEKGEIWQ